MAPPGAATPLLSAKQVVFAGILLVVVSVVAFVAGLVVGRDDAPGAGIVAVSAPDAAPLVIVGDPGGEPTSDGMREVTYPSRLGADAPPEDSLRGLPPPPAAFDAASESEPESAPDPEPDADPEAEPQPDADGPAEVTAAATDSAAEVAAADVATEAAADVAADADAAPADPAPVAASEPYAVQVAALRAADSAAALAERLVARGFPAYVVPPPPEGPFALFRVRVGRYAALEEAEAIQQRLEREEQLSAWITR